MLIELDRKGLEILVKGSYPSYKDFNHPLIIKAGHSYSDQYGKTEWRTLSNLNDEELYMVYLICRISWLEKEIEKI
jgi:hypothetical protein